MKRISLIVIFLLCSAVCVSSVFSQSQTVLDRQIYNYQNDFIYHPDGVVGKLSAQLASSYITITNQPGQPVVDAQKFQFGIGWVLSDKLSERQSFTTIKEFQTSYEVSFGLSYYLSNPITNSALLNPDGKVGSPVLMLDAIIELDSYKESKSKINYKSQILFPLSQSFSIFGGYTAYNKIGSKDIEKIFGGVHLYLSAYNTQKYSNPDSAPLGMAILLSGGSSEFGNYGQLALAIPSSNSVTITVSARGDFLEAPYDKRYSGSLQINFYSGK